MVNAEILILSHRDVEKLKLLLRLFADVFGTPGAKMPSESYLQEILRKKENLVFVAWKDGRLIGGLTVYILSDFMEEKSMAYIYDLAVDPEFQRQGIGSLLMTELKNYCTKTGIDIAFVQAEESDGYAVDFYRKIGGEGTRIIQFEYLLKGQRP